MHIDTTVPKSGLIGIFGTGRMMFSNPTIHAKKSAFRFCLASKYVKNADEANELLGWLKAEKIDIQRLPSRYNRLLQIRIDQVTELSRDS